MALLDNNEEKSRGKVARTVSDITLLDTHISILISVGAERVMHTIYAMAQTMENRDYIKISLLLSSILTIK